MSYQKIHKILVKADEFSRAEDCVSEFFSKTTLINYDSLTISQDDSLQGSQGIFWYEMESSINTNRKDMDDFVSELKQAGVVELSKIHELEDPYLRKLFHIIAHFVDGLIGIDSTFYNINEGSHWLSDSEKQNIQKNPEQYWLLHVTGSFTSREDVSFLHGA